MVAILSEAVGYLILLGVGLIMALVVTSLIKAEFRWLGTKKTSEWFSTAGRNIKTGLIASSVVSAWTWAATLLQSSTVAYQFGISGPFWYAAGASIQVVLFAILAIELKRKAPMSHTFTEIIHARFGRHAHKIFLFFALMTNTIVTAMLVLGGAAVVNSLTGIDIYIAAFLIPLGVIIYTFFGGLKATFLADYLNTAFIFAVVLTFVTAIYFTSPQIGGISGMYDKLTSAAVLKPVEGNSLGAYLTLASTGALIFGIINIVGNFGTVFVDQAYWQRAIASSPRSAVKGFLVGGLAWFAIPFTLATTLGLAAVAVGVSLTPEQIGLGLAAPTAASQVLGDVGAILLLTMLFMAVTSAGSAELVAVSSLVTYDIYRTYVKPSASGRELIRASRLLIIGFGLGMGVLASVLLQIGAGLQYVYLVMGILIGSAVSPIALSILWKRTNRVAASLAAIMGLVCGVAVWLASANALYGEVSIFSTGQSIPLLMGNVTSISVGAAVSLLGSLLKPENFNFNILKQKILLVDDKMRSLIEHDADEKFLANAARFSYKYAIALTLVLVVIWPLPLYFSGYVFSLSTYYVWVGIAVAWASVAAVVVVVLPLIEARSGIMEVLRNSIIPLILGAIIAVAIMASVLLYSSLVQQDPEIAEHTLTFIYSILAVMGSFAAVVIMLNRRLTKLVVIRTRELEKVNEELKRKDRLKDEFISIASHELRTPIQPILGFTGLAKKGKIAHDEAWDGVLKHARRLQQLANDILDVSRIESGSLTYTMEKVRINDIILDVVNAAKQNLSDGLLIETELDKDVEIDADKGRITQVLTNIVGNAVKFTREGRIKVESRIFPERNKIEIDISDTGGGIPNGVLPNIFDKFVTSAQDGNQQGAGLGLFISKAIVTAHKGEIFAYNNNEGGATFTIILPVENSKWI